MKDNYHYMRFIQCFINFINKDVINILVKNYILTDDINNQLYPVLSNINFVENMRNDIQYNKLPQLESTYDDIIQQLNEDGHSPDEGEEYKKQVSLSWFLGILITNFEIDRNSLK